MMNKRKFKQILSLVLSLILAVSVIPSSVSAQEVDIVPETKNVEQKTSEVQPTLSTSSVSKDLPEDLGEPNRASAINSGVYAISSRNTNMYVRCNTVSGGTYSSYQTFSAPPASETYRYAMFKIIYRSASDDYVIRCMTNNEIVIYANLNYNAPLSLRLSNVDDGAVPAEKAWKITATSDGYYHISCTLSGTTYYMCMPTSGSLTLTTDRNASNAKWSFHKYTGATFRGWGEMNDWPEHIENGSSVTIEAYIYSTVIGENRAWMGDAFVDPDVAEAKRLSYTAQMTITPKYGGNTHIRIEANIGSAVFGNSYIMSGWDDGCFYIKNKHSFEYMTLLNGISESELRLTGLPNGTDKEYTLWRMVYWSSGYYRIVQDIVGDSIYGPNSTSANMTGQETDNVWQQNLWKFIPQSDGTFKIQSYYHVINNPNHYISLDNTTTKNIRSLENTGNKQLWAIIPLKFNLDVYYDQAFVDKHSSVGVLNVLDHVFGETSIGYSIADSLFDHLGIRFNVEYKSTPTGTFFSYPYENGCLRSASAHREELCFNHPTSTGSLACHESTAATAAADCKAGHHHKNKDYFDDNLPTSTSYFPILFTGQAACSYTDNTHTYAVPLGYVNTRGGNRIVILNSTYVDGVDDNGARLILHEILHVLNASDDTSHYDDESSVEYDPTKIHRTFCVMGRYRFTSDIISKLTICTHCSGIADLYKYSLFNH